MGDCDFESRKQFVAMLSGDLRHLRKNLFQPTGTLLWNHKTSS